nr:zinc finger protein constans-like 4 [Quercus suber]POF26742.1 zinc finger protein constans-like 4 [Quercus suber]
MCKVCEQALTFVRCKADAAALCITYDSDIHSANPHTHCHERVSGDLSLTPSSQSSNWALRSPISLWSQLITTSRQRPVG